MKTTNTGGASANSLAAFVPLLATAIFAAGTAYTIPASHAASKQAVPVSAPIIITSGGTYSGNWVSKKIAQAAVTIETDQPVILENAEVSGPGTLISIRGVKPNGARVTLQNVTGIAGDPGVVGAQRGKFVDAENVAALNVTHCSMTGVSFGIYVASSTATELVIDNNAAYNLEDRASNGEGAVSTHRPSLGHFVQLNGVLAPNGAQIAWNQVVNTSGKASVEDIINIYNSSGGSDQEPIHIHDNYLQGAFSPGSSSYSGSGIMTDGPAPSLDTATGYLLIEQNQVVHTANIGICIEAGHDISMIDNRVVSCGKDSNGNWIATSYASGAVLWNYLRSPFFFNNSVIGTTGGLVRPSLSGQPMAADLWAPSASSTSNNREQSNAFADPCLAYHDDSLDAEVSEFSAWQAKLKTAAQTVGASE